MSIEQILGGKTEIKNNATAFELRTQNAPFLSPETQPILYGILKKIADRNGMSVEQVQSLSMKEANKLK